MNYKQAYMQYLDRNGIKYTDVNDTTVRVSYKGDNMDSIPVLVIFDKDGDPMASFRVFSIVNSSNDTRACKLCNQMNNKYRWVSFYYDSDGDINAQFDVKFTADTCGELVQHGVRRMVSIIDDCYNELRNGI